MAEVVTFELLSNGAEVGVEVEVAPGAGLAPPSINWGQVQKVIEGIGKDIGATLKKVQPTKGTVEFGLELKGDAQVPLVAKGSATAHITVTLEWEDKST